MQHDAQVAVNDRNLERANEQDYIDAGGEYGALAKGAKLTSP